MSYHPKNSGLCSWLLTEIRRIGDELWIGTGLNGISVLSLNTGSWTNYAVTPNHAPPNQIRALSSKCTVVRPYREPRFEPVDLQVLVTSFFLSALCGGTRGQGGRKSDRG